MMIGGIAESLLGLAGRIRGAMPGFRSMVRKQALGGAGGKVRRYSVGDRKYWRGSAASPGEAGGTDRTALGTLWKRGRALGGAADRSVQSGLGSVGLNVSRQNIRKGRRVGTLGLAAGAGLYGLGKSS